MRGMACSGEGGEAGPVVETAFPYAVLSWLPSDFK